MAMLCPVCRSATFEPMSLDDNLPADECTSCHGHWLTSPRYFAFLASSSAGATSSSESPPGALPSVAQRPAPDSKTMKLCPLCAKFMHYYRIGPDLWFGLDKCNTCGGVWLNQNEYAYLKSLGLHIKLHAITDDVWQSDLSRQQRLAAQTAALIKRLGQPDYDELQRITAWINGHPRRVALLAHLRENLLVS